MEEDFQTIINKRRIFILWDTGASKSIISRSYLGKLHSRDKTQPCTGIHCLFVSGNKIIQIGQVTLDIS